MGWKKYIILFFMLFLIGGCASGGMMTVANLANMMGGEEATRSKNPLIEAEIDLVLVDELAAMVKLNQIMLERMPVSYEDPWPELLNDYYKKTKQKERKAKSRYNKCLERLLKKDFSFYSLYNPDAYTSFILARGGFGSALGALGSRMFIEGCKKLGLEYEHAKTVLSYIPFGCDCGYFRPGLNDVSPGHSVCRQVRNNVRYKKCDFFNRPTEYVLTKYLFQAGGVKRWADLPVELDCFRPVRGEQLGTFKKVFYSLLDPSVRTQIERVDDELMIVRSELEAVKARLKDNKLPSAERAALRKKKGILAKEVKNKEAVQKKLYKMAMSQLNVTRESLRKAKKLKEIVDYIDRSFAETLGVMINLTLKLVNDVQVISKSNMAWAFASYSLMVNKGVVYSNNRAYYENRYKLVANKLISLPVTYFEILGYAIAQEYQVSKYKEYLKAMVEVGKKLKKSRGRL